MAEESVYFEPEYEERLRVWQQALEVDRQRDADHETEHTVPIKILVWGPGDRSSHLFGKRRTIANHLNQAHARNSAVFSEDILRYDPGSRDLQVVREELRQARLAEVIIILEADGAAGAYAEKVMTATRTSLAGKVFDLIPEKYRPRGNAESLAQHVTELIPNENIFYYSKQQLSRCHDIRAWCEAKVAEVRIRTFFQYRESRS